jgi:hypothetical protein
VDGGGINCKGGLLSGGVQLPAMVEVLRGMLMGRGQGGEESHR